MQLPVRAYYTALTMYTHTQESVRIQKTTGNLSTALLQRDEKCLAIAPRPTPEPHAQVDFLGRRSRWQLDELARVVDRHGGGAPALAAAAEELPEQALVCEAREALVLPDARVGVDVHVVGDDHSDEGDDAD